MAKKVDFESIAQTLEKTLISETSETAKRIDWRRGTILRECRTIGFKIPRQTGKTKWVLDRVKKNPKHSMVFLPTETLLDDFEARLYGDANPPTEKVRAIAGKPYERGYTHFYREAPITHVYVDEAYFYFTRVRKEKFYDALLTNFTLSEDVIIYFVN